MLLSCFLLHFKRSCVASFLFDHAPPLLTWFLCVQSNPVAFSFPPLPFLIQSPSSFPSSADLSSGFKISGKKRLDFLLLCADRNMNKAAKGCKLDRITQQGSACSCSPLPSALSASCMVHSGCLKPQKMTMICTVHGRPLLTLLML